ncbi:MAG: twin-arginine translocation signal domain-containing protein, partial [Casimicrobiaceae bacterium]
MTISRRTFLAAGLVGAAALATAGWLKGPHAPPSGIPRRTLDADAEAILAAMVPVLLEGALPSAPAARQRALAATLTSIDIAIAGLPLAAQAELAQLFALLALPPVRLGLARVSAPWPQAAPADVRSCLDRFRTSSWALPRAAYDALHQLTFAAWYGNPQAWPA